MKLNFISISPVQICLMEMANLAEASHHLVCLRTEELRLHFPVPRWQDWWRYSGLNHSLLHAYTHTEDGFENTCSWQHMQRFYRQASGTSVSHIIECEKNKKTPQLNQNLCTKQNCSGDLDRSSRVCWTLGRSGPGPPACGMCHTYPLPQGTHT